MASYYEIEFMELRPMPERFFMLGGKYAILHHYTKKQNITDLREVDKALKKLDDWYKRKGR